MAQEERQGDPQRDELRHRQVDEDDSALQNVDSETGMDQDQEHARQERVQQKAKGLHPCLLYLRDKMVLSMKENQSSVPGIAPTSGGITTTLAPVSRERRPTSFRP